MAKPNIGAMADLDRLVIGQPLSIADRYDWEEIGGRWGYAWRPVVNSKGIIVDIIDVDGGIALDEHRSFNKHLPVRWDGYAGAYRVTKAK